MCETAPPSCAQSMLACPGRSLKPPVCDMLRQEALSTSSPASVPSSHILMLPLSSALSRHLGFQRLSTAGLPDCEAAQAHRFGAELQRQNATGVCCRYSCEAVELALLTSGCADHRSAARGSGGGGLPDSW